MTRRCTWKIGAFLLFGLSSFFLQAAPDAPALQKQTQQEVESHIRPLLEKYCKDACQLLDVQVEVKANIQGREDLGFESTSDHPTAQEFLVSSLQVEIQIDKRVATSEKNRLQQMLQQNLSAFSPRASVAWKTVEIPQIGTSSALKTALEEGLKEKIRKALESTIQQYCPDTCILSSLHVDGQLVTQDEATQYPVIELVQGDAAFFHVQGVSIHLVLDQKMKKEDQTRTLNLMKAKTGFVEPVDFDVEVSDFPESISEKQQKQLAESQDPYGLEKLRRMLQLFRELAGTKEIITTNSNKSESALQQKEQTNDRWLGSISGGSWQLAVGGLVALLLIIFLVRYMGLRKDAQFLVAQAPMSAMPAKEANRSAAQKSRSSSESTWKQDKKHIQEKLTLQELKSEIVDSFLESPLLAKETMLRILHEEGIESAANYVHSLGKLAILELFCDPASHRRLYELSEFYHKAEIQLNGEEEEKLLRTLRKKMVAAEIKLLMQKDQAQFQFLDKLDPAQLYQLIEDEAEKIQSIVLTQLMPQKRSEVFAKFSGSKKTNLLESLGAVEMVPKEYLHNVARALKKKMGAKPEFDGHNIRSKDILLDLLERSSLDDQKALMLSLQDRNPEAARNLKSKLITVEILPLLKDGHLLELVLELDGDTLVTFLAGATEKIRDLFLSHVPEELAQSWVEQLHSMNSVEEEKYRVAEVLILARVRHLAEVGVISLFALNSLLFQEVETNAVAFSETDAVHPQGILV